MKETLPWVAFLEKCNGVQTEVLKDFVESYTNRMFNLGINDDTLMSELYLVLSYLLLERLGEED